MGWNLPGQSSGLCGQAIQVAACGAHSAGIRNPDAAAGAVGLRVLGLLGGIEGVDGLVGHTQQVLLVCGVAAFSRCGACLGF